MTKSNIYRTGLKNARYLIIAQGIFYFISILLGFLLPKIIGVTQYGYWQVYILYFIYVPVFCLGFNDGLYLRYGKYNYMELSFRKLCRSMQIFIILNTTISFILFGLSFLEKDPNKVFAFCATSINLFIVGINGTLISVLLFTNRIKMYTILTVLSKAFFVLFWGHSI
jgi:hypothetical protein